MAGQHHRGAGDLDLAVQWYRTAADLGDGGSMFELAHLYDRLGDPATARSWWERAAESGDSGAMHNFAVMLDNAGETDNAAHWYRRSALAGDAGSLHNLAVLHERQGDDLAAMETYREALAAGQSELRPQLAAVLRRLGRAVEANEVEAGVETMNTSIARHTHTAPVSVRLPQPVALTEGEVFSSSAAGPTFLEIDEWRYPVTYFVGRNGSGKSRAARALCTRVGGRLLATDRLVGLMTFDNYEWGAVPVLPRYRGVPLDPQQRDSIELTARLAGAATDDLYALREQPEVMLRVAAFIRRALHRDIELRETAGFLDPYVRVGTVEYSLLRDEGHGLRELVVLLAAVYRNDWSLLVVDEPELHLHPSMVRLWLTELNQECRASGRRAVVVTHEPSLIRPTSSDDLGAIYHFQQGRAPIRILDAITEDQLDRVTASIAQYQTLVSQLVFAPRPVLVEGDHDVAALKTALVRLRPAEVVAQTEFVTCGGSGAVGLWFDICTRLGIDVRAVLDLDAVFDAGVQKTMDGVGVVADGYATELVAQPPKTSVVVRELINAANRASAPTTPKGRAAWLASATELPKALSVRKDKLLAIWRGAGVWVHPQGTLEQVLGVESKGVEQARGAAMVAGHIDAVAEWCAFDLDPTGDLEFLLNIAVEKIVHALMVAIRSAPGQAFTAPVGPGADGDARLVDVAPLGDDTYRITVKEPQQFAGWWLEFSRDTPASKLHLVPREDAGTSS